MTFDVFTQNNCGWCTQAKALIASKGHTYREVNLSTLSDEGKQAFKMKHSTVPQVYLGSELIGGYEALEDWFAAR